MKEAYEMKLENLLCFGDTTDLYSEIQKQQKKSHTCLYIWGTGSVAAGAVKECEKHNIHIDGLFVNVSEFNIDPRIDIVKFPIFRLQELIDRGEEFSVIIGHAHYEYIRDMETIPLIKKIWTLTGVVREDIDISEKFVKDHMDLLQMTYDALDDDTSKKNMVAYLNAKITGKNQYVLDAFDKTATYFQNDVLTINKEETYFDLGAYDGTSIKEFINVCPQYNKIIAVEVQPEMAYLLRDKYKNNDKIVIYNLGISDHVGKDYFNFNGQSTCLADSEGKEIKVLTVDQLCEQTEPPSIIKICIGNTITPLLKGSEYVIYSHRPKLIIAAGIDRRALLDYIPLLNKLSGDGYKYYLRFNNAMTEALVLYVIPK